MVPEYSVHVILPLVTNHTVLQLLMYLSLPLKSKLTEGRIIFYSLYTYTSGKKEITNERRIEFCTLVTNDIIFIISPNKIILVNISWENSSSKLVNTQLLCRGWHRSVSVVFDIILSMDLKISSHGNEGRIEATSLDYDIFKYLAGLILTIFQYIQACCAELKIIPSQIIGLGYRDKSSLWFYLK